MSNPNTPLNYEMPAASIPPPAPSISTAETLSGIFFEPGKVFESFRERPRFLVATAISVAAFLLFTSLTIQKIGYENTVRAEMEASPRTADMTSEQKEQAVEFQLKPVFKILRYVAPVITLAVIFAVGASLYLLGVMAMAGKITYKQALAVWAYSSLPQYVLLMFANIVVLFLKPVEDIDPAKANRGLVHANPSFLIDSTANPVLGTLLGTFDLFSFYGMFLAALGLQKVARLKAGAAWGIVIALWVLGIVLRVAFAAISGSPMA